MSTDGPKGLTRVDDFDQTRNKKNRSPRVWLLIAGVALALSGAVVGGIAVLNNSHGIQNRNSSLLADVGLSTVSLEELIAQAKDHDVELYWVGPLEGDRYATDVLNNSVRHIHYLVGDPSDVSASTTYLRVATYPPLVKIEQLARGPLHATSDVTTINGRGDTITYNPGDLSTIVVKLAPSKVVETKATDVDKDIEEEETVVLEFSADQTLAYLIQMSEKITPLY